MAYPRALGFAPLIAAELIKDAPAILADIEGLFQGSSYDATHQQILAWSKMILADPNLTLAATQDALLRLRCWAGDQSVITPANTAYLFGSGNVAQGCGCETAHGCRADAQQAIATLEENIPGLTTGNLSSASYTNPVTGLPTTQPVTTTASSGLVPIGVGGGYTVGVPVPASSLLGATIGGVPIVLGMGAVIAAAFLLGKR